MYRALNRQIYPKAEIQLPSEIKHKGLQGSVSSGSVMRMLGLRIWVNARLLLAISV